MKKQLLDALKLKYKNLGLGEKVLEGIAEMLAITTTGEEQVETAVNGVETLLKGFQADADKRVTDAVAKVKQPKAPEVSKKEIEPDPEQKKEDGMPEWAKTLLTEVKELKTSKTIDTRKQTLEAKLKDFNPAFTKQTLASFAKMQFETEEDFNAYVEETVTNAGEFAKAETEKGLGASGKPFVPNGGAKTEASKEEVEAIVNEII